MRTLLLILLSNLLMIPALADKDGCLAMTDNDRRPALAEPSAIQTLAEPGVSLSLAEDRARRVSDVDYRLGFTIPASKEQPVTFTDTITFTLRDGDGRGRITRDLLLDYKSPTQGLQPVGLHPSPIGEGQRGPKAARGEATPGEAAPGEAAPGEASINGKAVPVTYTNEHLVLPARYLRRGRNTVIIEGVSDDKTLNRHDDYLYTLFVPANARSAFACFDQPDLKATFHLTLRLPDGWTSISSCGDRPLPTYLFSFTAGRFFRKDAVRDGRTLTALYRETDPKKVAQLDTVFDEIALSLRWMERYTGIPMPFSRYGFVVLPGYQFGGMEHPGAIQFVDREIFLGEHPTPDEELTRLNLLAHETAHLWFGDMVTMRWFNDVWTKEVFANLMASKIAREQFPDINHDLNFLHSYYMRAMSTDRTDGTHPIQQPLANLNQAGLLYGNIIYEKAPIMMQKLEELMGSDAFQRGLQAYLHRFAYRNATWDDLIAILDSTASTTAAVPTSATAAAPTSATTSPASRASHHRCPSLLAPGAVRSFSDVWVKEKGMPTIYSTFDHDTRTLTIRQEDPFGRGLTWPQTARYAIVYRQPDGRLMREDTLVDLSQPEQTLRLKDDELFCIHVNSDGKGYGRFCSILVDDDFAVGYDEKETPSEVERYAAAMNTMNGCMPNVNDKEVYLPSMTVLFRRFADDLPIEQNTLTASALCSYLTTIEQNYAPRLDHQSFEEDGEPFTIAEGEQRLWALSRAGLPNVRKQLLQWLGTHATTPAIIDSIYNVWLTQSNMLLDRTDYTRTAYHLAIMMPDLWQDILATQRQRLTNADELAAFDFISCACNPDPAVQDSLFESLLVKDNRRVEPWASSLLALLNDPTREGTQAGAATETTVMASAAGKTKAGKANAGKTKAGKANAGSAKAEKANAGSNRFLLPGLDLLEEVQRTGDIFFPANWLSALLSGHHSKEAAALVNDWLSRHEDYFPPLRRKVLEASFLLRKTAL